MARDFGEGEEWDIANAGAWSDEEFEYNCNYLLDRGGDALGTPENDQLVAIVTARVGEDKVESTLEDVYQRKFGATEEAPEPEEPAGADEPDAPKRGAKK